MIVMVVSVIACLLFTTRYLFSGRALLWARIIMLLFNVIRTGYRAAETIYNKLSARYGYQDETLTAFQQYTDEMRNKHQKNNA